MKVMARNAPEAPSEGEVSQSVIGKDFSALTQQLHEMGCFKPHYADEVQKGPIISNANMPFCNANF